VTDEDPEDAVVPAEPRAVSQAGWRLRLFELLPYALFSALFLPHLGFVPIWDGRQYADVLVAAAHFPPRFADFNIFGHPSMLFMLLAGLGQFFVSGSAPVLNFTNFVFGFAGIVAFRSIAGRCFPGEGNRAENILLSSIYAVFPIVLASELNLNADTGILVFSLLTTALLLAGRYRWAAAAALVLIYSKETGILLYGLIVGLYLLVFVAFPKIPARRRIREVLRRTAAFAPIWIYAAIRIGDRLTASGPAKNWMGVPTSEIIESFLSPSLSGIHAAYLTEVWILNFDWILTAILTAALVVVMKRIVRRRNRAPDGADPKAIAFVGALGFAVLWALTRFPTYSNPRYLLPVFPLFLLVSSMSLRILTTRRGRRQAVLGAFLPLAVISCFRTVDPLSKEVWGTFLFGDHEILAMTSLAEECCGLGRDQLEYNLEYTKFDAVQNRIFAYLHPDSSTTVLLDATANWFVHGELDAKTFRRSLRRPGTVRPRYLTTAALSLSRQPLPPVVYFIAYPNVDNRADMVWLGRKYRPAWVRDFADGGYSLPVVKYELRR